MAEDYDIGIRALEIILDDDQTDLSWPMCSAERGVVYLKDPRVFHRVAQSLKIKNLKLYRGKPGFEMRIIYTDGDKTSSLRVVALEGREFFWRYGVRYNFGSRFARTGM